MISICTRSSLGLILTALLVVAPETASAAPPSVAAAAAPETQISERARNHFNAGVNLLQDPDGARYEEAYPRVQSCLCRVPVPGRSWAIWH